MVCHYFLLQSAMNKWSLFLTSSPACAIICFTDSGHFDYNKTKSQCGFNLPVWWHMPIRYAEEIQELEIVLYSIFIALIYMHICMIPVHTYDIYH